MVEYINVHKSFESPVLRGVDLRVEAGETFSVVGPSGTGKSVLLKTTIGLIMPDRGDVRIAGESVYHASREARERLRRKVGYVFQNAALFDSMTVLENLALALVEDRDARAVARCRDEATELLLRVNLEPAVLDKYPAELSGGMRKRVGVARAIASRPRYLLYDEPTTGLDPVNASNIDRLIVELGRDLGVTSIVVTHDLDSALQVADRIALLIEGRIHACAAPAEIMASDDPVVRGFMRRGPVDGVAVA